MPVQNVRLQFLDDPVCAPGGGDVAGADVALNRRTRYAEREAWLQLVEQALLEVAARSRVADDADQMTGRSLRLGQVAHMPEDASDGRAKTMDDPQFLGHGACGHRSEEAFADVDGVAWQERVGG